MKILFCHGLEGSPTSRKAVVLREAGHDVLAPALPKEDLAQSVQIVRDALASFDAEVIVGSSRGGAVAMKSVTDSSPPLVLLAPAWRLFRVEPIVRRDTRILHGIKDAVVPLADSIELERRNDLPPENLLPINDDHRLVSPLGLAALAETVARIAPRRNQIRVIRPYLWEGVWVFDDPAVGLEREALVAGVPEMIALATRQLGIPHPEKGFVLLFSDEPFPGEQLCLDWVREESGGNVYRWPAVGLEGWLCPALFRYFDRAPAQLHIEVRPAGDRRRA
jgi:hypothetical protein